jgi:hypothetical protein
MWRGDDEGHDLPRLLHDQARDGVAMMILYETTREIPFRPSSRVHRVVLASEGRLQSKPFCAV